MNNTNIHTQTNIDKTYSLALGRYVYHFNFAFENREQYLDFIRFWKANYAALSVTIRDQKRLVSDTMRRSEYAGKGQLQLLEFKAEATLQLEMRRAAKVESHRQYLALKQPLS